MLSFLLDERVSPDVVVIVKRSRTDMPIFALLDWPDGIWIGESDEEILRDDLPELAGSLIPLWDEHRDLDWSNRLAVERAQDQVLECHPRFVLATGEAWFPSQPHPNDCFPVVLRSACRPLPKNICNASSRRATLWPMADYHDSSRPQAHSGRAKS